MANSEFGISCKRTSRANVVGPAFAVGDNFDSNRRSFRWWPGEFQLKISDVRSTAKPIKRSANNHIWAVLGSPSTYF